MHSSARVGEASCTLGRYIKSPRILFNLHRCMRTRWRLCSAVPSIPIVFCASVSATDENCPLSAQRLPDALSASQQHEGFSGVSCKSCDCMVQVWRPRGSRRQCPGGSPSNASAPIAECSTRTSSSASSRTLARYCTLQRSTLHLDGQTCSRAPLLAYCDKDPLFHCSSEERE